MNKLVYVNNPLYATHLHNQVTGEIIPIPPFSALSLVVDSSQKELIGTISYRGVLHYLCIYTHEVKKCTPKLLGKPKYEELGVVKEEFSLAEAKQFRRTKLHKATHLMYMGRITNNFMLYKSTIHFLDENSTHVLFTEYKKSGIIPLIRPTGDFKHRTFEIKDPEKLHILTSHLHKNLLSSQSTYVKIITPLNEKGNNELKRGFRHESQ